MIVGSSDRKVSLENHIVFKANMFKLISEMTIVFLMAVTGIPAAYSEDVITIIPCSSNHNNPKFFDTPYYYIQKGQQIHWHNADDINHRISHIYI